MIKLAIAVATLVAFAFSAPVSAKGGGHSGKSSAKVSSGKPASSSTKTKKGAAADRGKGAVGSGGPSGASSGSRPEAAPAPAAQFRAPAGRQRPERGEFR